MKYRGLLVLSCLLIMPWATAKPLQLVTTEWETFTSDGSHSARLNQFVVKVLERAGYEVSITIERRAFAGSGLNTGVYDGQIDAIGLEKKRAGFIYSDTYFPLHLHLISKQPSVENIRSFAQIRNARVAVENRYAATPSLRLIKDVKWSRNPSTFESIANIAGDRSDYLLADNLIFAEFNRLLSEANADLLHRSRQPLFATGLQLNVSEKVDNASNIIDAFNRHAKDMLKDGSVNQYFGIRWIVGDINGDGIAEWISSSKTYHHTDAIAQYPAMIDQQAFRWDDSVIQSNTNIIIDGQMFLDWSQAKTYLVNNVDPTLKQGRGSFLDKSAYQKILNRW